MEIEAFKDTHMSGIIDCLKRNYESFKDYSDKQLEEWIKPLISYNWIDDIEVPYKYGMVLMNENQVVGYCGLIYSKYHEDGGEPLVYVNPTTWAIDEKYRLQVFKVTKEMLKTADVVGDFTSRKSMEEMCTKVFKYEYLDNQTIRFLPIPKVISHMKSMVIKDIHQIHDESVKSKYLDHKKYGVKVIRFSRENQDCYVFYKIMHLKIKGINTKWARILDISDNDFFAENIHGIMWKIQCTDKCLSEVDRHFIGEREFKHPLFKYSNAHRLVYELDKIKNKEKFSYLYSELAMLK